MKFEALYKTILEGIVSVERGVDPTPEGAKRYKNSDLGPKGNRYLRFDLGYSSDIAKIVYDFIHKTNEDNGYYRAGFRVIAYFLDHPLLSPRIGYGIITPTENEAIELTNVFLTDLWEYALKTNKEEWSSVFRNPFHFYENGWDHGYFRARTADKLYIWEYDPMDSFNVDKDVKDKWRRALDKI